jgi:hypothetical protein
MDRTGSGFFSGYDGIRHDHGLVARNQVQQKPAGEACFDYIDGCVAQKPLPDFTSDGDADAVVAEYGIAESEDERSWFQK